MYKVCHLLKCGLYKDLFNLNDTWFAPSQELSKGPSVAPPHGSNSNKLRSTAEELLPSHRSMKKSLLIPRI